VLVVPGFGPVALSNLKQWRSQQERRFRFDPNKAVDPAAKNKVEREISTEKVDLERKLNEGLSKLMVSSHHILTRRQKLLEQAEQTAADIAQAEADLRASSTAVPIIIPRKWAIITLAGASIGTLMIATHQPQPNVSRYTPAPTISSPMPPRPMFPPHVEADLRGQWQPEDGYDWLFPNSAGGKSVRWVSSTPSTRYPNVVTGLIEGQWRPAVGYAWVINPHRSSGDMRVAPVKAEIRPGISAWMEYRPRHANRGPVVRPRSGNAHPFDQSSTIR
jgi:hypothetical protein